MSFRFQSLKKLKNANNKDKTGSEKIAVKKSKVSGKTMKGERRTKNSFNVNKNITKLHWDVFSRQAKAKSPKTFKQTSVFQNFSLKRFDFSTLFLFTTPIRTSVNEIAIPQPSC